ncbi:ABC1 family protein [Capsaspora owczarzaki ATCC 30864]|uniref:ABC1 family protein n=1 Tax=Capsaspora owczarzaki (strain ATCC 30864) TaxID=595528 RepID=A0A0D2WIA7_CAPO3|nr:ABC1 family protein [Capsaspora owczarzaki ATCC 30864]KJE88683.1 ABC1 family protein [Capsaspora owczarzaki ATCC 30864]|eukprot:XP_004365160.1 ABC1 family protein [Capsaspora owczarzaki ATCC 30864]
MAMAGPREAANAFIAALSDAVQSIRSTDPSADAAQTPSSSSSSPSATHSSSSRDTAMLRGVFQFRVSNPDMQFVVDLAATPPVWLGTASAPDCTLICAIEDLQAIAMGQMSMPTAVLRRKIKIEGNRNSLLQLAPVFKRAAAAHHATSSNKSAAHGIHANGVIAQRLAEIAATNSNSNSPAPSSSADSRLGSSIQGAPTYEMRLTSRAHWAHDMSATECPACLVRFSLMVRRHHCRFCGMVFCATCTAHTLADARVCLTCFPVAIAARLSDPIPFGMLTAAEKLRLADMSRLTSRAESIAETPSEDDESPGDLANGGGDDSDDLSPELIIYSPPRDAHHHLRRANSDTVVEESVQLLGQMPGYRIVAPPSSRAAGAESTSTAAALEEGLLRRRFKQSVTSVQEQQVTAMVGGAPASLRAYHGVHPSELGQSQAPPSPMTARFASMEAKLDRLQFQLAAPASASLPAPTRRLPNRRQHSAGSSAGSLARLLLGVLAIALALLALFYLFMPRLLEKQAGYAQDRITRFVAHIGSTTPIRDTLAPRLLPVVAWLQSTTIQTISVVLDVYHNTSLVLLALGAAPLALLLFVLFVRSSKGLFARRVSVYYTAVVVISHLKFAQLYSSYFRLSKEEDDLYWQTVHSRNARRVFNAIVSLKGFWVKVGQYMSARSDVLPDAWITELVRLQDQMPPQPFSDVEATIREDFGREAHELFETIEKTPIAAASIAQVHRATLKNGTPVVVKVQHRDVDRIMRQDMVNLEVIMTGVAYLNPEFDFRPVVVEWAKEAVKELDFHNEAENMATVATNLRLADIDVIIPDVVPDCTSERVLVQTFVDGFKVTDLAELDRCGVDRLALVRRICQAYAHQVYIDGFFNADPHAGNILVDVRDGKATPVLLDFGLTKKINQRMRLAFSRMIHAAAAMDYGGLLLAFEEMGLKLNRDDPMEDMNAIRFVLRDTSPSAEARDEFNKHVKAQMEQYNQLPRSKRNPVDSWPGELVFFFRVTQLLRGLCSAVDVRLPYLSVMTPYARLALLDKFPHSQHARHVVFPSPVPSSLDTRVRRLLHELHQREEFVGIQVAVFRQGVQIVDACAGTLGTVDPRPVRPDSLFNVFSATKPVAALAVHVLASRGLIRYSDRVSKYWPEFAQNGKGDCTVAQALSHTAGLHAAVGGGTTLDELVDYDKMLDKVAKATPVHPPGKEAHYHYLSFGWLLGGIVQSKLTGGRSLSDIVKTEIVEPLGIQHEAFIGLPLDDQPALIDRCATLINSFGKDGGAPSAEEIQGMVRAMRAGQTDRATAAAIPSAFADGDISRVARGGGSPLDPCLFNLARVRKAAIPAANGHFSARALAKIYASLACGGAIPQSTGADHRPHRLLSADTVSDMRTQVAVERSPFTGEAIRYGLGVRIYGLENPVTGSVAYTAFGHSGIGGSIALCDADSQVSIAITVNKLTMTRACTNEIVQFVCEALGIGLPVGFE